MVRSLVLSVLAAVVVLLPLDAEARRGGGWGRSMTVGGHDRGAASAAPDRHAAPDGRVENSYPTRVSVTPFRSTTSHVAPKTGEPVGGAASGEPYPSGSAMGGGLMLSTPLRGTRSRAEFCPDGELASNSFCVLN